MVDSGTKTMGSKHKLYDMVDSVTESMGNKRSKLHGIVDSRTETVEDQFSGDHETADVYSHMVDSETETMDDQLYGDHETQVSEGGEADLHKHLIGCKKNPGHKKFIPVDTFTINHLPEGHRDKDLYEHIKATADLTVRVDVKMTSPHRPKFWPNTKVSYPFYNTRNKENLRTGSGMVSGRVNKFTDGYSNVYGYKHLQNYTTCWCKQCQHSDTASQVWWEFNVNTATHVVFDDIEASHTSLRLFYDKEESPVVSVDQVNVVHVNIKEDRCVLRCVTCDKNGYNHLKNYTTCWCKQYQRLDTASHKWWEFILNTSEHVQFNIEINHKSPILFYNIKKRPVVSVDQVSVVDVEINEDRCVLRCVTSGKHLGDKLGMLWQHHRMVWWNVLDKYTKSRDVDKLNFIVSHPHGCCKQVSVGHWLNKYKVDGYNKFTYTTCTCPGSSGANVHCVGYNVSGVGWLYQPVHSGSLKSQINYSGVGQVF